MISGIPSATHPVLGLSDEDDARRVLTLLPKRSGKYGLALHPEKTRPIDFRSPRRRDSTGPADGPQQRTFDLLGFTHYWSKFRRGYWVIKQKTAKDRLTRGDHLHWTVVPRASPCASR
jgi:hypothetical protein